MQERLLTGHVDLFQEMTFLLCSHCRSPPKSRWRLVTGGWRPCL